MEIGTLKHKVLIEDNGDIKYRISDYRNRNNWKPVIDKVIVKSMAEYIEFLEENNRHLENENYMLTHAQYYKEVYDGVKEEDKESMVYIWESHLSGNWYHTDEDQDYDDLYCETCGDSDNLVWCGTVEELWWMIVDYI